MTPYALLRDDNGTSLIIDGALSINENANGRITDKVTVANKFIVDGRIINPKTVVIEAIVSPYPLIDGLQQGQARIDEVLAWLEDAKDNARVLVLQAPGRQYIENMVLETYNSSKAKSDSLNITMNFKETRIAITRSTTLTQRPKKPGGGPKSSAKAGLDPEKEKGAALAYAFVTNTFQFITGKPAPWDIPPQ